MPRVREFFPTLIHQAPLGPGAAARNRELLRDAYRIREHDAPGRKWSRRSYPGGYTSYGSLDQLHRFSSAFDALRVRIDRHARAFARALHWDLRGEKLVMTDCWLNIMPPGCAHSFHLHPQAVLSGTYYVRVPPGAPGLKVEDPRLSRLMAAPMRDAHAPEKFRPHVTLAARAGEVILFESWLRHEVPANAARSDRVSISFNYHRV